MSDDKQKLIGFILKLLVSILTAAATAFGVTSCMALTRAISPASGSIVAQLLPADTATTATTSTAVAYPWATDYDGY